MQGAAGRIAETPQAAEKIAEGIKAVLDALHPLPGAKPATPPFPDLPMRNKVTPIDVQNEIVSTWFINGATGVAPDDFQPPVPAHHPLASLTICVLVLRNGTKVVGINHGAIDPANHSEAVGRDEARKDATAKVWELLGFRLRDQLAAAKASGA